MLGLIMGILLSLNSVNKKNVKQDYCVNINRNVQFYNRDSLVSVYGRKIEGFKLENDFDLKNKLKCWVRDKYLKTTKEISIEEKYIYINEYKIYSILLEDEFPTSLNKCYTILYRESDKCFFFVPINFDKFIINDNSITLSGFYEYREYDYYIIYSLHGNLLIERLDSQRYGMEGLVGFHRDDECIEYFPRKYISKVYCNSIVFEGVIKNYCKKYADRFPEDTVPLIVKNKMLIFKKSLFFKRWKMISKTR